MERQEMMGFEDNRKDKLFREKDEEEEDAEEVVS